jgi:hypothetical protein
MMVLKDAFASLLADLELRAAWNQQGERSLGAAVRRLAIMDEERKPRLQTDLFRG